MYTELLKILTNKYATCASYEDSGSSVCDHELSFSTFFVRPDLFLFEWHDRSTGLTRSVQMSGSEVYFYCQDDCKKYDSIADALSETAGSSNRIGSLIGSLLLPKIVQSGPSLINWNAYKYATAPQEAIVELTSVDSPDALTLESFQVDMKKVEICGWKSTIKSSVTTLLTGLLPQLEPAMAAQVAVAIKDPTSVVTNTQYNTVEFNKLMKADLLNRLR